MGENNTQENTLKWTVDSSAKMDEVATKALELAGDLSRDTGDAVVIALHGNLGAGKTTFTKHLAKILGIKETVTSPTFVIQKNFAISDSSIETPFKKLIHIDTYRIDLQDELVKLGWHENLLHAENLLAVEWPENIPDILPTNTISIHFKIVNETTREIEIK